MGELVLAYDVKSNNKTSKPRALYALYIGPNDGGTGHSVSKLSTKKMIITSKCKPIPMPNNVIEVVNQMEEDDGSPDGIVFVIYTRNQLWKICTATLIHKTTAVVLLIQVGTKRRTAVR